MRRSLRPIAATTVALMLLASVAALSWLAWTSGVLSAAPAGAQGTSLAPVVAGAEAAVPVEPAAVVAGGFQVSQPRDPFRPLITEDSPFAGRPGVGGVAGGSGGFTPSGTTITLDDIRDVAGLLRATVIVNGINYDVGVGETFAGSYKVISLNEEKGVFMFGDSAFELTIGQQILK